MKPRSVSRKFHAWCMIGMLNENSMMIYDFKNELRCVICDMRSGIELIYVKEFK